MGNLNVTYKTASLEDLAKGIEEMAAAKEDEIGSQPTKHYRFGMRNFVDGMKFAADIVRNTTIDPTMEADDAAKTEE